MKLHDAITLAKVNSQQWFRPVGWVKTGQAYCIKDGCTALVPSARGGIPGMTSDTADLVGDWEVLAPSMVLDEADALRMREDATN